MIQPYKTFAVQYAGICSLKYREIMNIHLINFLFLNAGFKMSMKNIPTYINAKKARNSPEKKSSLYD